MALNYKVLLEDTLHKELAEAANKLVVVDFTSARCPPCQRIAPAFEALAPKHPNAVFIKVDINLCPTSAQSHGITATPTFVFYRNKTKIDMLQGANPDELAEKVKLHYGDGEGGEIEDCGVPGHMDLLPMIVKNNCECLNESDDHTFLHVLDTTPTYLESDTDEQLIMNLEFNQAVKIHSLKLKAPSDCGPKTIKLFINQPHSLDFDSAESNTPAQQLELTPQDLESIIIPLKYVKFQNVMNLAIFVKDNQTEAETTKIEYMQIIGSVVATTNMSAFKRISGKKGESH